MHPDPFEENTTVKRSMTIRARFLAVAAVGALAITLVPAGAATASGSDMVPARIDLPTGWQPEGVTSGLGKIFSGSIAGNGLYAADIRTGKGKVILPGHPGLTIAGLYFARRTGVVWAVGSDGGTPTVWAVDAASGAVRAAVPVPAVTQPAFLNDVVATRHAVWVTESFGNRLVRIRLGHDGLPMGEPQVREIPAPYPTSAPTDFKANGIRALRDGSLVLNQSTAGGLWRYDPKHRRVTQIKVTGSPAVLSGDGLDLHGSTLYNVRGSGGQDVTVLRLREHHGVWTAKVKGVLSSTDVDVPTTGTLAAGSFWVVNARFGNPSPATADFWVTRLDLLHG